MFNFFLKKKMCFLFTCFFLPSKNKNKTKKNNQKIIHCNGKFYKLVDYLLIELKSEELNTKTETDIERNILNTGRK